MKIGLYCRVDHQRSDMWKSYRTLSFYSKITRGSFKFQTVTAFPFCSPQAPHTTTVSQRHWKLTCTLLSKLNLLRSLDSVALLSPCVSAPYQDIKFPIKAQKTGCIHHLLHTSTQPRTYQALKSFSNNRSKSLFPCQFRNQKHILGSSNLVWSMSSSCKRH